MLCVKNNIKIFINKKKKEYFFKEEEERRRSSRKKEGHPLVRRTSITVVELLLGLLIFPI